MKVRVVLAALALVSSVVPAALAVPATAGAAEGSAGRPAPNQPGQKAAAPQADAGDFELRTPNRDYLGPANKIKEDLTDAGIGSLLEDANRRATTGCDAPEGSSHVFCFQSDSDGEGDDQNTEAWYPQGISTVSDAVADEKWGDKKPVVNSWYSKEDKGVRLTFLDPSTKKYRHVLLAIPGYSEGQTTYRPVVDSNGTSVHAGGIVWYGKHIYVADTNGGIRVFSTDYLFDLKKSKMGNPNDREHIGSYDPWTGDRYYAAYGYRYVMLQVGAYVTVNKPDGTCGTGPARYSYIGLDRSAKPDQLLTGEYCRGGEDAPNGRVASWNLKDGKIAPVSGNPDRFRPQHAYTIPTGYVQGAALNNGKWYFTHRGEGPGGYDKNTYYLSRASVRDGKLELDAKDAVGTPGGRGPSEDLSFYNSSGKLWTLTEKPGSRAIYSISPPS